MSALPILYSFRRCPYAMRARLALQYAGVKVRLREIVLRDKPAEMLAISPKGTVPVLQLSDGTVLEQSLDIMRWACQQSDPDGWLSPSLSPEGQAWLDKNDGPFKLLLDRYKYADRYPEVPASAYRDQAVDVMLQPMEERLGQQAYLFGDAPCLVDVALMPFVRQFAQVDAEWFEGAALPRLQQWLQAQTASSSFERVMTKYSPWRYGQPDEVF